MDSQLPAYLKSLEAIIAGNTPSSAPTQSVTSVSNVSPSVTQTPMFTTAMTGMTPSAPAPASANTSSKQLKFLMVSTHAHQFTGYSKVSYNVLQVLSKLPWLSVTHYGFQKFPNVPPQYRPYPPNIEVIDGAATEKPGTGGQ